MKNSPAVQRAIQDEVLAGRRYEVKTAPRDPNAWDVYLGDTPQTHLTWCERELAQRICDRFNAFVDGGGLVYKDVFDAIVAEESSK